MTGDPAGPVPPDRHVAITSGQGYYAGDHGVQVNLFGDQRPTGPVVAGNVPQAPPAFQPRDDLMTALRIAGPGVSVACAVTGMRGVGKTQLAAAYARECRQAGWRLIAWVNAESAATTLDSLAVVADRLGIDRTAKTLDALGLEVRNRLEADGDKCLIVFDNVTDPDAVQPYIPSIGDPQVLVTSTESSVKALGKPLQVAVFTEEQALAFLAERTSREDGASARTLARDLGYLPLALSQAAAVIAAQYLTYQVYLDRLRTYPTQKYLPKAQGEPYPRGAAEAILLSIDAVTATDPTGRCGAILDLVSVLSPTGVARELLSTSQPDATPDTVDEALGRLAGASLLTFSADGTTVTAHRLVTRVARERRARDGTLTAVGARSCELLSGRRRSLGEPWQDRPAARDFVQQVTAVHEHLSPHLRDDDPLVKDLLNLRGWALSYLNNLADSYSQAVDLGVSLVADRERVLGESHPDTLTSRNNLASAYRAAGRVGEAILLHERTLADCERVQGESHPDTLTSRNNLASAYQEAGRVGDAVPLLERTVADRVRVLGESHPITLHSRNNLANVYQAVGRVGEAIPLLERTLADRVGVLGESHPDTIMSRYSLAVAYQLAGRVGDAMPLLERTVADYVRVLGESHPYTLHSRNNLASAYWAAGRVREAIPLFEAALAGRERVLGAEHPDTVLVRGNLDRARRAAQGQGSGPVGLR